MTIFSDAPRFPPFVEEKCVGEAEEGRNGANMFWDFFAVDMRSTRLCTPQCVTRNHEKK